MADLSSENEPVNLLSCDGGGIRGVSGLVILDALMKRIQKLGNLEKTPRPCDYFHLIGGTSTGGLLAIMLGRLEMSTQDALKAYDDFAEEIFFKKRRSVTVFTEKYDATKLEKSVQRLVQQYDKGTKMSDGRPKDAKGRAFVCTLSEQKHKETICFRTYDVPKDKYSHILIYQAARATTAATTYFRPMSIEDDTGHKERFIDAALGTNNPISLCLSEAAELYGTRRLLGTIVSLGTGTRTTESREHGGRSIIEQGKWIGSIFKVLEDIATNSEDDHKRMKTKFADYDKTYFRFNVDGGAQGIKLSDWKRIKDLKKKTSAYLQDPEVQAQINELADVLLHRRSQGLMIAHGGKLSRELTIPAQPRYVKRGKSSDRFIGRDDILRRLDEHFGPRQLGDTSRRQFQIYGLGGMGKTQIALKFIERNELRFHVLWVDASDDVTIKQSFQHIAFTFEMAESKSPVDQVLRFLATTTEEWLLVFDNSPDSGLSQYIPDGDKGNILYTTRHRNLRPRIRPDHIYNVAAMRVGEAVRLLLASAQLPEEIQTNWDQATEIVNALGLLPLAIDQAGAYINMRPCRLDRYLAVFNQEKDQLLKSSRYSGGDELRNIAVYATFNISFDAIKACADKRKDMDQVQEAKTALDLLRLLCFYHNEGLLFSVFRFAALERYRTDRNDNFPLIAGDRNLNELVDTTEVNISPESPDGRAWLSLDWLAGMKFLDQYSLIKFDDSNAYSNMHILVHGWARDRLQGNEKKEWALAARSMLMDSIDFRSGLCATAWRQDVTIHLQVVMDHADIAHPDLALESEYQAKIAKVFRQAQNFSGAATALEHSLEHRKSEFGPNDKNTLTALSQLADIYTEAGRFAEAESVLREVIDRRRLLSWEALWEKAITSEEKAKLQAENFYSDTLLDELPIRLDTKRLLSVLLSLDCKPAAEHILKALLKWTANRYGQSSIQTSILQYELDMNHAGAEEYEEGKNSGAFTDVEGAREGLRSAIAECGPYDPQVIAAKQHLAKILTRLKQFDEAYCLHGDVCEYNEGIYGKDSIQFVDAMFDVAQISLLQSRPFEADSMLLAVVDQYTSQLGRMHPKTLQSLHCLSFCYALKGEFGLGVQTMSMCLEGRKEVYGLENRLTKYTQNWIRQIRHYDEMLPEWTRSNFRNRAIDNSKKALGDFAPEWMKQWVPVLEEEIMLACAARGEELPILQVEKIVEDGFTFHKLEVIRTVQPQAFLTDKVVGVEH